MPPSLRPNGPAVADLVLVCSESEERAESEEDTCTLSPFSEAFSQDANTLARPLVGALSLVEYWESEVRPKKSRAVLKEISPALGEAMVPGCEDDAAGAARVARIGLRWRLHDKVHLDEPTGRMHTAPSHGLYFWSTGSRFSRPAGPRDNLHHQLHRVPHRSISVEPDGTAAQLQRVSP